MADREFDASVDGAAVHLTGRAGSVATQLRRRRELLGISQVEAARRTGVARTVINEIERGKRIPSLPTWQALREGLGMLPPPAVLLRPPPPADLTEAQLRRLAACAIVAGGAALGDLAHALGISIPAVREGLSVLGERFAAVGLRLVEDGVTVRVAWSYRQSWPTRRTIARAAAE